jgi:hypothetical protein
VPASPSAAFALSHDAGSGAFVTALPTRSAGAGDDD